MTAPTHTSFGILFILGIGLLLGITVNPVIAVFAAVGALLPDIDTPKSAIGNFLRPIAGYIERKLGHRQATHSLLALLVLGLVTVPLRYVNIYWWIALLCGYLSHLIIDTINKSGVPLFYPSSIRAVMPKSEKYRITVGSKAECIFFIAISVIALLILPINRVGLFKSLHYIIKDTRSAIADYRSWADSYRVYALVAGTFNVSQQPIQAQFEVLGIDNQNSLVVYDSRADLTYTVGTDKNANIYPQSIRCIKGEEIDVITKRVHLENELLGNLINHIPKNGQTFIKGTVKTTDKVILPRDPDIYETIRPGINEVELRYARERDFKNVFISTIFALSGDVYLRIILPALDDRTGVSQTMPSKSNTIHNASLLSFQPDSVVTTSISKQRVHTTEMYIQNVRSFSEILVQEGQFIKVGEPIAMLTYNEAKLKLKEQTIQRQIDQLTSKPIDSHALFLASQKIKAKQREYELQQAIFKATQKLYNAKAISQTAFIKEEQKLKQAEVAIIEAKQGFDEMVGKLEWEQKQRKYQIDQALLKLEAIRQELKQNNIYSAVNARVILIRIHAIHNNNLTIAIKLLVNAPSPTPKPKIEPSPPQKEMPDSDNSTRVMERKAPNKSVSFFKNTRYRKKTHTKFHQEGGKNAVQKTIIFNPPLHPISLLRGLWCKPVAPQHYHQSTFFT